MRIIKSFDLLWTPRLRPQAYPRIAASTMDVVGAVGPIYGIAREADT